MQRFVVAVAFLAVCSTSPVLINGVLYRDGRSYSLGQAYNYNGGASVASANANGDSAQAYGSSSGNQYGRDGFGYPGQGQAMALAQTTDPQETPYGAAKAVAQTNGGYYPVPAPATVITYEQNFAQPAAPVYVPGAVRAHSSAVRNGATDTSITSVTSNGAGIADATANTGTGSYGLTSSHSKTYGGYGHADSQSKSGYGSASTSAKTVGQGIAESTANSNGYDGVAYPAVPAPEPVPVEVIQSSVADLKTPKYHTVYVPVAPATGVASSNANVIGAGNAASSAKVTNGKTISWRFGTYYDGLAANAAQAQANTYGQGIAKSHANTNGYGSADADANVNSAGYGSAKSVANSNDAGSAVAGADVNGGYGAAKSAANTHYGSAVSNANSNGYGHAKSAANINGGYYGGSRTSADAQSNGYGHAASSARAQPVSTGYRVAQPHAGNIYARANAQTA